MGVTIHDMVAFTHPQFLTSHGARWHQRMIERAVFDADAIFVPTQAVATQLRTRFGGATSRFTGNNLDARLHLAPGASSFSELASHGELATTATPSVIDGDYLVFLGTIEPRKGLDILVRAVASSPALGLVVIGRRGWGNVDLRSLAQGAGLDSSRLLVAGALPDREVAAIVSKARALVLPSRAEGFGLPLVEAMELGTPIVYSSDEALREVAGGVGFSFDFATDVADSVLHLRDAIDLALSSQDDQRVRGMARAAEFSWNTTASRVWSVHHTLPH